MEDFMKNFMNIVFSPLALLALLNFYPYHQFLQHIVSIFRTLFSEDVAGKVVLITGASSGIGEHVAYEYAKRGACLALVARRESRLREVAAKAEQLGSPYAIVVPGDVTKIEDCKRFIETTIKQFGRLNHLVSNAGVAPVSKLEDIPDIAKFTLSMDINFWGSVYTFYFALPQLKRSKGRIVVISSVASWLPAPRMCFYSASKAALESMYETLRVELGTEIGITIVTPGLINSEMTGGKFFGQKGDLEVDKPIRDVLINVIPLESPEECAKAIVRSACRGDEYLLEPAWYEGIRLWKIFGPDVVEWYNRFFLGSGRGRSETDTVSRKILDITNEVKEFLMAITDLMVELVGVFMPWLLTEATGSTGH